MADLFYNDINLMREAGQINILTPNSGSGISHDLIARAHTSTISNIYRTIQRFLPTTAGKNSAFLYHLGKAMNMSRNSKELLFDLATNSNTPPSMLKELRPAIEAYNSRVGNALDKAQEIQTAKDEQNYLDVLESSQKYQRSLDDTSKNIGTLETMETTGISDVGNTGGQALSHRGDTEGLLSDSGKIRTPHRDTDGEFRRISRGDEGGDRPLRTTLDGRGDEADGISRKIPQEPTKISKTDTNVERTAQRGLETNQTQEGTLITEEGLSPSPSLKNLAKTLKDKQDSPEVIADFGTNYPEYYHNGKGAIQKLLQEKHGQVQGAFYRPDIGDITLIWGKEGTGKSDGFGLSKIAKFHPEVLDKLDELINTLPIVKESPNRYQLENENYKLAIRKEYEGDKENWVLTAFEKDGNSASSRTDFRNTHTQATDKTTSVRVENHSTTEKLKNQELIDLHKKLTEKCPSRFDLPMNNYIQYSIKQLVGESNPYEAMRKNFQDYFDPTKPNHNQLKKEELEALKIALKMLDDPEAEKFIKGMNDDVKDLLNLKYRIKNQRRYLQDWQKAHPNEDNPRLQKDLEEDKKAYEQKLAELTPQQSSERPQELPADLKTAYDKYQDTKTKEYQTTTKAEKSDIIEGQSSSMLTSSANKILEKNPLELPYHNNYVKESLNEPFGIDFRKGVFDEIKGEEAIKTLLTYKLGQVKGAFYKEGLGDIDLVWGNEKMGLAHILDKHPEVIEKIPEIIEKGKIDKGINRVFLNTDDNRVAIALDYKGEDKKWIITAYDKDYLPSANPHQGQLTPTTSAHRMRDNLENHSTTEKPKNQDLQDSQDLVGDIFSEMRTNGTLSQNTKEALEKKGYTLQEDENNLLLSYPSEKSDKDLEPLPHPNSIKALITPSAYTEFDPLGNTIKDVSITSNSIVQIQKEGNITTTETLNLENGKSTKEIEVKDLQVHLPITSPSSSSAPSSAQIASLRDDFTIAPNTLIPKSPKKRFENNIEALKILKRLQEEKTLPTLEEKQKLSLYVGWGGLSHSFKENSPESKILQELLSQEEYQKAKSSTLSSYYTPYFVVEGMWKALEKMGFSGGNILEPSVGVGNFFGLLPHSLRDTSNLLGIELDNTTAKIAKYLYPQAKIEHMGYESAILPKNNYDLVIGNPPYGSFSVYDKNFKKESGHNIHNYFMLKNLALTKEDGILAQIITTNFLDTKNPQVRELIAKEAEFLGAIRLPQGAFDDTGVATDIVFFRKLKQGETSPSKEWVNLKNIPDTQGKEDIPINAYFANNPQYMLGTPGRYGGMYGADTIGFKSNGNTEVQLQKALEAMTEGIHINTRPILATPIIAQKTLDTLKPKPMGDLLHSSYIRSGGIGANKEGEIYRLTPYKELEKVSDLELIDKTQEEFDKLTALGQKNKLAQIAKIKEIIPAVSQIRDSLMLLKKMQLDPMENEASISLQRKNLNDLYDNFRSKFNIYLSDSKIAKAFDGDPTYPHISALEEDYKKVDKKYQAKKADIFRKRTQFPYVRPTKAQSIEDGIAISYNQNGKLDFETIGELLDKDSEAVKKEILDKNLGFKDSEGNIIDGPLFLSGNILAKIKSFENKELDSYQNKALKALKEATPPKVEIEGIGINMGANYIPIEIYQDFAKEVLGGNEKGVSYQKLTDDFIVNFKSSFEADKVFGVEGEHKSISASDVFEAALNDKKITMGVKKEGVFYPDDKGQIAIDQQIEAIKIAFKNFIYDDYSRAEKIENVFNDIFNATRLRDFDGSFLKLEGSSDLITLRPHQKNAIFRTISSPATLLDHTVGTGKTYTMVGSVMELRRLGLAQKPLIVVPNHIVNQFGAEFARLYPSANILATRKFDKKSRQRTLSAITTGDWDAIIIGHSNFEMLPMSQEFERNFLSEQIVMFEKAISEQKAQEGESLSVKKLQQALENKKEKLQKLLDSKKDETINFEDLGIDALFLDEAHEFKNLEFYSRQNISGLGNQKGSKKAFDLFMKTRYLHSQNKKIVFATGTPISNSIAELYTLQRYLDFEGLQEKGINSFDQWSKTFGKIERRFEYHPSGGFKLTNRFTGYVNMPELIKEYKKFADVIVNEDVEAMLRLQGKEFNLPKPEFITIEIKKSPIQEDFMKNIMKRSSAIDKGLVEPFEDNYLKVTTDGKKGSLDMRLIDPLYEDNPNSKVNTSIKNILKEYRKWKNDRGTQLVFLDMSTPKNKNPKAKKELNELLKKIEQGDEEAEEILQSKGGSDYIKMVNNDGFSVYEDIRDKLIKEGVPEKEIAFIHDFDTDKKKAELFNKVNEGEIRILLGSTSKMGAGTNVQERIVAIHHLDAPWRPADIEQRNGRGIRQGNQLYEKYGKDKFKVNIYTYVTKGMLDTMIFEKLHTKAKFISQLRKGELSGREIEDIGDEVLNFAEIQAATLEDKRYLEALELKREIDSLSALQKNIANINLRTSREINSLQYTLKHKPKEIEDFKVDMHSFNKGENQVQIGNTTYIKGQKDNGLQEALEGIKIDRDIQNIYKYNGFIIEASISKRNADFGYVDIFAHSPHTEQSYLISTIKKQDFKANGVLSRIDNYFKAQRLLAMQDELKNAQTNLPKLKASLKKFDKEKELQEKTKQHLRLIEELGSKLNSHPYVGLGLFGAISGGNIDYNQDGKNDEVDMLLGALGAVIGGKGVKYLLSKNQDVLKNVLKHYFPQKKQEIDSAFGKDIKREKRGIYNVAYNNKKATIIKEDLKSIDNAILFESGRDNSINPRKGYGSKHIKSRHTNPTDEGYITQQELLNIGNHMREYLKEHKEPFIDKNGARIYEWENNKGVRFRVVVGNRIKPNRGSTTRVESEDLPLFDNRIVTFYSDRNLKQKMKFRNPALHSKDITIW